MQSVTVYTTAFCPFCSRALTLLAKKGAAVTEIAAGMDSIKKAEMMDRSGGKRTFPQIFIGETHVGGCDDLHDLEARGGLDLLLNAA